jgi:hypothetical protein
MSVNLQSTTGAVTLGFVVGAAALAFASWLGIRPTTPLHVLENNSPDLGKGVRVLVDESNGDLPAQSWISAVEKAIAEDTREQPWKIEIGDLVADREFLSYRPTGKLDDSDVMKNAIPVTTTACGKKWAPYPTYDASSSEDTITPPTSRDPPTRPWPTTFTG